MANIKEIQDRMNGIRDTRKITNAMYLISSSKLRKARKNMEKVSDYFMTIKKTVGDILDHMPEMEHIYLEKKGKKKEDIKKAFLVITADKGLAGSYNLNAIKMAEKVMLENPSSELFVVGQVGIHYFQKKNMVSDEDFLFSSQNPSLQRARSITVELLEHFRRKEIDEVYLIFTQMKNALQTETVMMELLPLSRAQFDYTDKSDKSGEESFFPDAKSVFNQLAPIVMHGIIFSALTESYCAELNDRMSSMDSASKSADEMLAGLALEYNRTRQSGITQEITEVIAGAKAQKKKKKA